MLSGKVAVVCGYGDVGKGSAASLRQGRRRVIVTEIDPICALQAAMEGYEVQTMEDVAPRPTSSSPPPATRTSSPSTTCGDEEQRHRLQHRPLRLRDSDRRPANFKWDKIKPQVHHVEFPDGKKIILLSEGRLVNLGNATGHPSFVMSRLVHQPDAGPDRTVDQRRQVREPRSTPCPSTSTRRSPCCTWPSWAPS
jgi:adenosylhomocysteinase